MRRDEIIMLQLIAKNVQKYCLPAKTLQVAAKENMRK